MFTISLDIRKKKVDRKPLFLKSHADLIANMLREIIRQRFKMNAAT